MSAVEEVLWERGNSTPHCALRNWGSLPQLGGVQDEKRHAGQEMREQHPKGIHLLTFYQDPGTVRYLLANTSFNHPISPYPYKQGGFGNLPKSTSREGQNWDLDPVWGAAKAHGLSATPGRS